MRNKLLPSNRDMIELDGIPASPGVVIGKAFLHRPYEQHTPSYPIAEGHVEAEVKRFKTAIEKTRQSIVEIQRRLAKETKGSDANIFQAHLMLLEDPLLIDNVSQEIERRLINAESALIYVANKLKSSLEESIYEYIRGRTADIDDVVRRILGNLMGIETRDLSTLSTLQLQESVIVIAHDLSPSETALMRKERVSGFATDVGSRTSHTAIIARSLEIPAVVGLTNVTSHVVSGNIVIIDGNHGKLIINPDEATIKKYLKERDAFIKFERSLEVLRTLAAATLDGREIELSGNIEFPEEVPALIKYGAKGIGLYRTEYFYIRKHELPSEEELFEDYKSVAESIAPYPVIIRTFDLGGDKFVSYLDFPSSVNSLMGLRAIRLCLKHEEIFCTQLRAILRASAYGQVKVMFPMISGLEELRKAKSVLDSVKAQLRAEKIPFDEQVKVGIMIEVPSAAITADILAKEVDFFSIGTNDLVQYALAVERVNEEIAALYEPLHPGVLRLIKKVVEAGHQRGIWVGMCGEMASDPVAVLILLGMEIDELSMSPVTVPEIKKIIRSVTMEEAKKLAEEVLSLSSALEIESYIRKEALQRFPELLSWASR